MILTPDVLRAALPDEVLSRALAAATAAQRAFQDEYRHETLTRELMEQLTPTDARSHAKLVALIATAQKCADILDEERLPAVANVLREAADEVTP